jgi:hypothetical protein
MKAILRVHIGLERPDGTRYDVTEHVQFNQEIDITKFNGDKVIRFIFDDIKMIYGRSDFEQN